MINNNKITIEPKIGSIEDRKHEQTREIHAFALNAIINIPAILKKVQKQN
jgi:hypothetical protein